MKALLLGYSHIRLSQISTEDLFEALFSMEEKIFLGIAIFKVLFSTRNFEGTNFQDCLSLLNFLFLGVIPNEGH